MKLSIIVATSAFFTSANAFVSPLATSRGAYAPRVRLNAVSQDDLGGAQKMIDEIVTENNCGPILVRLAWHDSGTFDVSLKDEEWPKAGGAIASIRFKPEIQHGANAGLAGAVKLLEPVKESFPDVSYADIFQMASARSIALAEGPAIDMKYGRLDAASPDECSPEGNLPDAEPADDGKYGGSGGTASTEDTTPNGHLRKVFYRMGLNDEEIVALSGAHTFGRAYKDRSGLGATETKFTNGSKQTLVDGSEAKYKAGGSSWTSQWLVFDNSYFQTIPDDDADPELLKLSTDVTLFDDDDFRPFAENFRDSQDDFFESYAKAHKKLSENGSKFDPPTGLSL
jgi:L-ascorbate peroxidase